MALLVDSAVGGLTLLAYTNDVGPGLVSAAGTAVRALGCGPTGGLLRVGPTVWIHVVHALIPGSCSMLVTKY
jgi:hypothetical protein